MNTNRLVVCITFLAVFAMSVRVSMDNDTWWHLRAGEWIVQNRATPHVDPFSYTKAGESWEYPGWLVEAPMYLLYRSLGPGGLNLWTAVMVTLTFVFVWMTLSGGVFLKGFVIVLAAAASGVYWAARPYLVTFLFTAIFLWILEDYRWKERSTVVPASPYPGNRATCSGNKRLWWLPVLVVIWANSHGGFAVGFILLGIYLLDQSIREIPNFSRFQIRRSKFFRLLLIGFLMVLAVCINPYGITMLVYPFKTASIGALREFIQEWQSPDFHLRSAQPFLWLCIATLASVGVSRRRLALTDFLLVGGFFYMSLLAWRNVALFALVSPAALTRHAAPVISALKRKYSRFFVSGAMPDRRSSWVNWIILLVLALAVVVKVGMEISPTVNQKAFRMTLPVEAVAYIKNEAPPGRLFNSYNWGGYLLWELPEYPVFIDGRTDLYDGEIIDHWLQVVRAEEGWQQTLDRWEVRLVLLEPGMPVVSELEENSWKILYQDERSVVYAR